MLTLADVVEALTGQPNDVWKRHAITSFCVDSRRCEPGSLFVALRGEQTDGHQFIADALQHGAQFVLAERRGEGPGEAGTYIDVSRPGSPAPSPLAFPVTLVAANSLVALQRLAAWWRLKFSMQVVGVTGSVGKTVTKETIAAVLSEKYRTFKNEGNLNSETGLPLTLLGLAGNPERAVLEMAMYDIGEIARLAEIAKPRIGVVTNVGPSHLERLGTIERIAEAKSELPRALPADGWAILNGDDPRVRAMKDATRAQVLLYGLDASNDLWVSDVEGMGLHGMRFHLHRGAEPALHVKVPLLGRHSVHTALAAAAVGMVDGLSWEEIVHGLQNVSGQLRLTAVTGINGSTIIDDSYNASPVSTIAALNLVHELEGRKIGVLADMLELGSFEREGHEMVGRRAADVLDILVAVGERAALIAQSARDAGMSPGCIYLRAQKSEAIELLRGLLEPADLVLVKGSRGMAMEDVVSALAVHVHPAGR